MGKSVTKRDAGAFARKADERGLDLNTVKLFAVTYTPRHFGFGAESCSAWPGFPRTGICFYAVLSMLIAIRPFHLRVRSVPTTTTSPPSDY